MLKKLNKNNQGFTLLELLLSMAIISGLAGLSLPVYRNLIKKNDLDIAANTVVSSLRRAQSLAQAVDGDSAWGLKTQSGNVVIFKGESFTGHDTNFDETFEIPTTISINDTTIVFNKFTGFPQSIGTINLSASGDAWLITINEKGMVDY